MRNPEAASSTITRPSITTRPIASGQVIIGARVAATSALMPSPVAIANGRLATIPNRMVITPAASAVTAATCGTPSTEPAPSAPVPRISGFSTMM